MDRLRTLLLARTHTVVLDPDLVANAATRPTRDTDVERFEDELAQLGFVMSLDLAMTVRRLPHQAAQQLRSWMSDTLAKQLGAHRPHVPLFRGFPAAVPASTHALYLRRILSWLLTVPEQPCPWCGELKAVGALDPCGHLVCRTCWDGGNYAGCPICHRRIALGDPFVKPAAASERVQRHVGQLTLLHLGFDMLGAAKARFERLLARQMPLSPDDRTEVESVIDALGPRALAWLPAHIPVRETMAIAVARLWIVSPDRGAAMRETAAHLRTATDVLRVAVVLMGGNAELVEPMRLRSVQRGVRRAVLEALERLPADQVADDVRRHARLWKRAGERLHPYEWAGRFPRAALAFAIVRGTHITALPALRESAKAIERASIVRDRVRVAAWAAPVERALAAGDPAAAIERLVERPGELLRRVDHVVRVTQARQPEALGKVLAAIRAAARHGAPATLLTLASHIARRGSRWSRRVFFPKGEVLRAWGAEDRRPLLRSDAIGAVVSAVRGELVARAEKQRHYPRAVIDRALGDLLVPINERTSSRTKLAWPRGSEIAIPEGASLRLFLHWEEPPNQRVDLDLSVAMYDEEWRHVATCDFTNLVVSSSWGGEDTRAAVHSGDLTSAPPPLGASEFVDLHLEPLYMLGVRQLVMVVLSYNAVPFDRLPHGFAGLMVAPDEGEPFDPRAVAQRFDLRGRSVITIPLTLDLAMRRLRWIDVHVAARGDLHQVGGYRAALAHMGRDFGDLVASGARPTLWDLACLHGAARANVVYVRERDGTITAYRRRDGESTLSRLARLLSGANDDGRLASIPAADAPTWFALASGDVALPRGSAGYVLDARAGGIGDGIERLAATDLLSDLLRS